MNEKLMTIRQAAEFSRVTKFAIYAAVIKGNLKAKKIGKFWHITPEDLEAYRLNKFNRDRTVFQGELVFDIDKGHLSIAHVAKALSQALKRPYNQQRIYYMIRTGDLKAFKKGGLYVILKEDAEKLLEKERNPRHIFFIESEYAKA